MNTHPDISHKYYVYILKCNDGSYYTGVTNNLDKRFQEHQSGLNVDSYTHNKRPVELIFYADFTDIKCAIEKEKQIKRNLLLKNVDLQGFAADFF